MKRLKLFACIALFFAPLLLSQPGYIPFATDFDATSDHYLRGGDLTGMADSKVGLCSFWMKLDGSDGTLMDILVSGSPPTTGLRVFRSTVDTIRLITKSSAPVNVVQIVSVSTYTASPNWIHVLASWDAEGGGDPGTGHLYIDDIEDRDENAIVDDLIDYTQPEWSIGASNVGSSFLDGRLSEIYFANEYLNITIEENRRFFITADGKPVDLGPGCYKPTGTAAIICMQTQFNNFGNNSGSGGDFAPQDPVTWTAGPVPILQLPGRATHAQTRGRGGRSR